MSNSYQNNLAYAQKMDEVDPLRKFRAEFLFPTFHENEVVYFTGNSLGLQPKHTIDYIKQELDDWAKWGVLQRSRLGGCNGGPSSAIQALARG